MHGVRETIFLSSIFLWHGWDGIASTAWLARGLRRTVAFFWGCIGVYVGSGVRIKMGLCISMGIPAWCAEKAPEYLETSSMKFI
jgi:hypothetical protein